MSVLEIICGVLMILLSVAIVVLVALQESPKGGISALTGGDSYFNKNQGRTREALLAKATKYGAIAIFVVTIVAYAVNVKMK